MGFGRTILSNTGRPIMVSADGAPEWKVGGVTINWDLMTAVSGADVTLADETVVKIGDKYMRYGQVLTRVGVAEVQTITLTGGPTAGAATLTVGAMGQHPETTISVAFDAAAAAVAAALVALPGISQNGAGVTRAGAGTNGDPYVYTVTFNRLVVANVPTIALSSHTFTGGTAPTATMAVTTAGEAAHGKYGPYDPAATDGRQTLARGACFILNETIVKSELNSDNPPVFDGGNVFRNRILQSGVVTGTLALGPTLANFETAFPRIKWVD